MTVEDTLILFWAIGVPLSCTLMLAWAAGLFDWESWK